MSCTYYLRDKKITKEKIKKLKLIESDFNNKLENLYKELNKKIINILPIANNDVIEECRQYEPNYENEGKLYLDSINNLDFGVYASGTFRFKRFSDLDDFLLFYKENIDKYTIIDEYNNEFTLNEFLQDVKLK